MTDPMSRRYAKANAPEKQTPEQKAADARLKAEELARKKAIEDEEGDTRVAQAVPMA